MSRRKFGRRREDGWQGERGETTVNGRTGDKRYASAHAGVGARRSLGRSRPRRLITKFNLILDKGFLRKLKKFSYISPYCVGLKKVS